MDKPCFSTEMPGRLEFLPSFVPMSCLQIINGSAVGLTLREDPVLLVITRKLSALSHKSFDALMRIQVLWAL